MFFFSSNNYKAFRFKESVTFTKKKEHVVCDSV